MTIRQRMDRRKDAILGATAGLTLAELEGLTPGLLRAAKPMYEALRAVFDEVTSGNYGELSPAVRAMVANALAIADSKEG